MRDKRPPASWNFIGRGWESFTGVFNRGFDRLSHGYANAADFVIRHSAIMLVVYVALIGSAGWLLYTTPQGFIPAQDRGYVIISVQLPGAASLARTTEIVREIEKIALDTPGIIRVAAFAGFSGATRTQAGNAAALFPVFEDPEERHKKGLTANAIANELRKRLSVLQGAFIIVIPPPAVPGIGTGGGFTMRVQDRGGRGPEMLAAATDELVGAARKAPGLTQVFSPFTANTPQVFVEIDRVKAQKLGVPIQGDHRYDPDLFRLGLCQRLQPVRPHLSRHRAGRPAVPQGDSRPGAAAHPQYRRRHGAARQRGGFPRCLRPGSRRALQSLSRVRTAGRHIAGNQFGHRDRHHEAAGGGDAAERVFL